MGLGGMRNLNSPEAVDPTKDPKIVPKVMAMPAVNKVSPPLETQPPSSSRPFNTCGPMPVSTRAVFVN